MLCVIRQFVRGPSPSPRLRMTRMAVKGSQRISRLDGGWLCRRYKFVNIASSNFPNCAAAAFPVSRTPS